MVYVQISASWKLWGFGGWGGARRSFQHNIQGTEEANDGILIGRHLTF